MLGAGLMIFGNLAWSADDKDVSDIDKRLDASAKVLTEIMDTPDKAIPDKVMNDAKCIAVIPSMVKIAIGIGGSHGKGVATCRTEGGMWSAPAPITITRRKLGIGNLGGQAVDIGVMVVMNDQGMQHLLSSKFKIGADASAWPQDATVGRDIWRRYGLENESGAADLLPRSRTLCGDRFERHSGDTGQRRNQNSIRKIPAVQRHSGGEEVHARESSQPFLAAVRKYSGQARTEHSELKPSAGTPVAGSR